MPDPALAQHSAIYTGEVQHERYEPVQHAFRTRLFLTYLDLDELERGEVFRGSRLFSAKRPAPARFRREDYHGDPAVSLQDAVRARVRDELGPIALGPVRVLTHLRYWGWCFNPVSFYYVFEPDGSTLAAVVAEITNTPWKERHAYVLSARDGRRNNAQQTSHTYRYEFDKAFHVSPFMDMTDTYTWRFNDPGATLSVEMHNAAGSAKRHFRAGMTLTRQPATAGALAKALVRHPWMTASVVTRIYFNALLLRIKGARFYDHPKYARERAASESGAGLAEN